MKRRYDEVIDAFKAQRVLVIGDTIADVYIQSRPGKICREAPVLVFDVQEKIYKCGGAANVALNSASLGVQTYFLSVTGFDAHADALLQQLRSEQVITDFIIKDESRKTLVKQRIISSENILMRLDEGDTCMINEKTELKIIESLHFLSGQVDVIIVSDYNIGLFTPAVISYLQSISKTKKIVVDAHNLEKYKDIKPFVAKPNYDELTSLMQLSKIEGVARITQVQEIAADVLEATGASHVASTLDCNGTLLLSKDGQPVHFNCIARSNTQAIGAGDTFISALAAAIATDADIPDAVKIAAAAASIVVQKTGTTCCTMQELKAHFNPPKKIIENMEQLNEIVVLCRHQHKRIVFTNGCFDIVHKGHMHLLDNAKKYGDILITGINSDASTRQLKGEGRPFNNLEDRIAVLAGFESVDHIIAFDDLTPAQLIALIKPDVFVKGGNYSAEDIPEVALLEQCGCTIKIVPYMEDHSTARIINRIQEIHHMPLTNVS